MRLSSFLSNLSILFALSPQWGQAATTTEDIQLSVSQFMLTYSQSLQEHYPGATRIEHQINSLDSRLSMADCSSPLSVERIDNKDMGRINLKISCQSPAPWSLYVPTDIQVFHPVVVSAAPINRDTQLLEEHLTLREIDLGSVRGSYYFQISDVVNMEAKRQLNPGSIISSGYLRPPLVIEKGDAVVLSAELGTLNVKTPAIALSDGRQGQQIRVQNKQSKRIVDARVTGPGAVKATL